MVTVSYSVQVTDECFIELASLNPHKCCVRGRCSRGTHDSLLKVGTLAAIFCMCNNLKICLS